MSSSWAPRSSATAPASNPLASSRRFNTNTNNELKTSQQDASNNNNNNNTKQSRDRAASMQIDGIAPTFQKKPSIRHEQAGKRLVFECLIEAEPEPTVAWFHNGQPLPQLNPRFKFNVNKEGDKFYKASLEISDITIESAGTYTINSKNSLGESNAKINLNFDNSNQQQDQTKENKNNSSSLGGDNAAQLDADYSNKSTPTPAGNGKPSFLEKPIIKQSNDFKQVQFDCKLVADPRPTIQWLHKGEPLDERSSRIETLLIAVKDSSSTLASSSLSSSSASSVSKSSSPSLAAQNKQLQQQHTYIASLILKGVESDRTGDYKCVASNKFGTNFASINLNFVQGKSKPISDGRAPKFPRKPIIKQLGSLLTIECVVEATPKPSITWFHDHESIIREDARHSHCSWHIRGPIRNESELRALGVYEAAGGGGLELGAGGAPLPSLGYGRSSFSSSSSAADSRRPSSALTAASSNVYLVTFEIRAPKARDGGTYRCNAQNEHGESSANIALNFQTNQLEQQQEEEAEAEAKKTTKQKRKDSRGADEQQQQQKQQDAAASKRRESSSSSSLSAQQQQQQDDGLASSRQQATDATSRRLSSASSTAAQRRKSSAGSSVSANIEVPMQVDEEQQQARQQRKQSANRLNEPSEQQQQQQAALDQLPPAKRTSSSGSTKRTTSVKKKRPPTLLAPGGGAPADLADPDDQGEPQAPARRVVKKRVSVKRGDQAAPPLGQIAEDDQQASQRKDSLASVASSTASGNQQQLQPTGARQRDRIPSFAVEAPPQVVVDETQQQQQQQQQQSALSSRKSALASQQASKAAPAHPRLSVTSSQEEADQQQQQRRGNYEGLRPDDELSAQEEEETRRRYLASRGGGGLARESLSPSGGLGAAGPSQPTSGSSSRQGSAEPPARRGSILLLPDALGGGGVGAGGAPGDSRRPSIIVADDNKLRPGEIADRRRRSSIDIRRASAIQVEAADRPSTPLKACGTKPAILDFQDNISGTENHTSYLTFGLEGDPVPTLRFFKGDSEIYEGGRYSIVTDGDTNTVHFCIRKSKPIDEAKYKVVATNCHGEDSASMQLFVSDESGIDFRAMLKHRQYAKWKRDQEDPNWGNLKGVEDEKLAQIKEPKRPDNFMKPLQNQKAKQGRDLKVTFECVFSKSGVKAKWFRNNREIFPNKKFHLNSRGDLHTLEIEGPYVEDGGRYTCQCLDTKCSAMLEVEEPDPVYKFTKILAKGYGQHLNRELTLEVTCNSHRAQVNWYKDDPNCRGQALDTTAPKTSGAKYALDADKFGKKVLRVRDCQLDDSGQYTCKIMNTPKADEVTSTQVLITEKKFQIMKPLYSQRATEDDKVVLECEVDELDAPVKWYRKDRDTGQWKELKAEHMKHKEIVVEGKKRRLVIKKAKCQDEGEYKCCTNADETSCELFVEPANKWRKKLTDVTVLEDEPLQLDVELMERKPGVALIWMRQGKQIGCQGGGGMQTTADERVIFRSQEDKMQLVIERAKLGDAGDWSVLFNKMKCSCKVTVLPAEKAPTMRFPQETLVAEVGKPMQIEIPYSVGGTKQSAVVPRLLCNGQPVGAHQVELQVKDDKIVLKFKEPQRADASDKYEFVLENAKGKQAQKFKLNVEGPPGPPEGPLRVTEVHKDRCQLNWERPLDDGGSPVAHYVIERQEVGAARSTWTECGVAPTCEFQVTELQAKKEYKFRVRAVNRKGKSEPLAAQKAVLAKEPYDPPSEPENLSVANWDKDFVDLEWEAPLRDGGVPIERYIIETKGKFGQDWAQLKEVPASAGCHAHVTEQLKEGQQLQFRVRAVNKAGPGEPSKATKPVAIKARFVRPYLTGDGLKNIVVKKGRPVRYDVAYNGEPAPEIIWLANEQELKCITDKCEIELLDKKTSLLVTNTTRADSGRYKLILKNSSGQCVSEADVVVLDRPAPPEGPLVVEELKSDQVTIKWRKPRDSGGQDLDGYVVEKMNLETGRWVPAGECGPKDEMFTVKNLMKGKKYKFRVRAKNKEGESEALETANVLNVGEEPSIQKCPSKVQVGQGETAKVKVHFQGEPSEFRIVNLDTGEEIGDGGGGGGGGGDAADLLPSAASGGQQPKYTVFDDYLTLTIPKATKAKHAGRYKVELKNKIGKCEAQFELAVTCPPGAPGGPLEVADVNESSASLAWRAPIDDGGNKVTHYIVERRDTGNANDEDAWIEVTGACKDTNYTVSGLNSGHAYEFRVMAVNEDGQSKPLVSEAPTVAKLPYDPPSAPGAPEAKPLSEDSVQLEWERPKSDGGARITGYFVEKRECDGSGTWQKVNGPQSPCLNTEMVVKNLVEDRKYEFRVVAQNAAGLSEPSECSAQTLVKDPNAVDAPKFVSGLKRTIGVEDGTFELECVVQGQPAPSVVWSKGSKELRDGGSAGAGKYCMTQESGPDNTTVFRLLVTRAQADDADEYSLKATNKVGARTTRCDVDIQTKPKIHVPPRLQADGAPITFDRGESIQLKIPFTGNPAPECHWFKGDEEIEPSAQFDIETDGRHTTLTIRDATREDSGDYRLVVSNKLGEDSASIAVSVADRPEAPRFPQMVEELDDSVTLNWKAPVWDGGSAITSYVIEKRELPMTSWIKAGSTRFLAHEVVNLNEEKDYEFRVFAENIYGRSEPSETIRCATKPSGKAKKRADWQLDAEGKKIRSTPGADLGPHDDYDKFVRDGPVNHAAADIKTCPITDNYEICEKIGDGIFGEVYRVKEKATGDVYAAKFTPTATSEEKALIKKEIDTINLLHHKNCLRLHDAYEDEDEMVTVHEFISGPEVFEKVCEPGYEMTEEQVKKYMRDVLEAVRHMHDRNVIHLDLKPENLMLQSRNPLNADHEPKVKLIDFGLACKLDPHEICKISTMAADYAAPEILEKDSVGFYTDMWASGVLAYVLLCGTPPFGSHSDIKAAEWSFEHPAFDKVTPECKDFIERLLVRQKEKRMTAHEALEHPWLREPGDQETRTKRQQPLVDSNAYRRQRDAMRNRYLNWWDKSIVPIGHISNYSPLRKLHADRYKIHDALVDRRELAPRFVIKPQSTFAYESQSAKFYCLISSDSPVTVSWFKDNRELRQSVKYMKRYAMDDNNFNFIVNRCKMSDFGEYVIRAENHHGWREEPVFLDVRSRPVDFTPVHLEPMKRRREPEPPKFEEEPDCPPHFNFLLRPRILQCGQSVKLICCLKGKPLPAITWLKDGKELSKRDYTISQSAGVVTLEIAACDTSHSGKYTCHAQNQLGEHETTAAILVEGKRTFTPTPMAGYLAPPSYISSSTSHHHTYTGRHTRSSSLSRTISTTRRSSTPPPTFATTTTTTTSPYSYSMSSNLMVPPQSSNYLSAKLYSPNYSINTNRYLRRSYKAGPMASSSTSISHLPPSSSSSLMTSSRSPSGRSRIPILGSRLPMRTLSSFGRSSSSLH